MKGIGFFARGVSTAALLLVVGATMPARAGDAISDWASAKIPAPPEPRAVTIDPKTTALLVLDFMKANCGERPRCKAGVPAIKKIIDAARAHKVPLFYTLVGADPTPSGMVDPSLVPAPGDFIIKGAGGADKFVNSNLEEGLRAKGVKTVIIMGTSAQGATAGTANGAAQRGFKAVVPVDGMYSEDLFNEVYAAWHIAKGGPLNLTSNTTLSRGDLIKYGD